MADFESFMGTYIRMYHKGSFSRLKLQQSQSHKASLSLFWSKGHFLAKLVSFYLYIPVHNLMFMQIWNGFTNIAEIRLDLFFCGKPVSNFLKQSSTISIFKDHECQLFLGIYMISKKLDDIWMRKFLMKDYLIDSRFTDLNENFVTILTATFWPVVRSKASLTCP